MNEITRRDWLVNFPSSPTGTVDLYRQVTVPINTTNAILVTWIVPNSVKFGVLKKYGFGYFSGSVNDISFRFTVNGSIYPQVFNTEYPGNIVVPVYALDDMHVEIKNGDVIVLYASNTSVAVPAVVWARTKGWYY